MVSYSDSYCGTCNWSPEKCDCVCSECGLRARDYKCIPEKIGQRHLVPMIRPDQFEDLKK